MLIQSQVDLKSYNHWKVGGVAEHFSMPSTHDQIVESVRWAQDNKQPVTVLGLGSNVLISDEGIAGLVICLNEYKGIESEEVKDDRYTIVALAGTTKIDLMRRFMKQKLAPALFLSGLPGNLAGGIVMNAGVSEKREPREFCEIVDWITVLKTDESFPKVEKIMSSEIEWSYRQSMGWQPGIILSAQLSWPNAVDAEIPKKVIAANKTRLSKQPLDMPSCGSTFKNPEGEASAGRLIEECGLKGFKVGGAQVSPKHANFIVNTGDATAKDIHQLISHVKSEVFEKKKVQLNTEVKYIGQWSKE